MKSLALPHFAESSIFSLLGEGASYYLGSPSNSQASHELYARLGAPVPRTVLIVPIAVKGRVTAYLYGDGGEQEILALDLPAVLSLGARAGLALQIIVLRNKILAS